MRQAASCTQRRSRFATPPRELKNFIFISLLPYIWRLLRQKLQFISQERELQYKNCMPVQLGPRGSKWRINFLEIFLPAESRRFLYLSFPYFPEKHRTMQRINYGQYGVNYSLSYAQQVWRNIYKKRRVRYKISLNHPRINTYEGSA